MAELQRVKASTIRRILAGDVFAIGDFAGGDKITPQGKQYWKREAVRLLLGHDLSPEARAYLENLLANGRRVPKACDTCKGKGKVPYYDTHAAGDGMIGVSVEFAGWDVCPECNGRRVRERNYVLDLSGGPVREVCYKCKGAGELTSVYDSDEMRIGNYSRSRCHVCNGTGVKQ